jgi:hypothetical protein
MPPSDRMRAYYPKAPIEHVALRKQNEIRLTWVSRKLMHAEFVESGETLELVNVQVDERSSDPRNEGSHAGPYCRNPANPFE